MYMYSTTEIQGTFVPAMHTACVCSRCILSMHVQVCFCMRVHNVHVHVPEDKLVHEHACMTQMPVHVHAPLALAWYHYH